MSLPHLPAETWRDILDEAIALPTFLDPHRLPELTDALHVTKNLSSGEREYWAVEAYRNVLRRVCKGWDAYLRLHDHRYVRLDDIWHQTVPIDALRRAKRINYRTCADGTSCVLCYSSQEHAHYWHPLVQLFKSLGEVSVEIFDADGLMARPLPDVILDASKYLPHLQVILRCQGIHRHWINSLESLPKLGFIWVDDYITFSSPDWPAFQAPNLTALSFTHMFHPFSLPLYDCDLPSLRHLRFPHLPLSVYDLLAQIPDLIRTLEVYGSNLLSLQLGDRDIRHQVKIPHRLWTLCPRLERLDTSLGISTDVTQLPPEYSTLQTLSFTMDYSHIYLGVENSPSNDPPFPLQLIARCPKLRRLIMQGRWSEMTSFMHSSKGCSVNPWMRELVETCRRHGVNFEDRGGDLLEGSELAQLFETGP